jgi:hypothetical protein
LADYFRLRQICLVANDLPRVIGDMEAIFGVKLAYQDPHVRQYGLENALFPFGLAFVEVVSPVEANTAAGRFLERGHVVDVRVDGDRAQRHDRQKQQHERETRA